MVNAVTNMPLRRWWGCPVAIAQLVFCSYFLTGSPFPSATAFSLFPSSPISPTRSHNTELCARIDCDVAIFGGGFGGLYAALALPKDLDVVLVEPSESFVFLPLLYDLTIGTASEAEVCPSYNDLLASGENIRHIRSSLDSIDASDRSAKAPMATCSNNDIIQPRMAAILAVGASPDDILKSTLGATELARPFYTEADAKRTRRWLNKMDDHAPRRIAVVGGGYGGVELSACLQRRWNNKKNPPRVTLLSRGPPLGGSRAETLVKRALNKLGVTIENASVEALEGAADAIKVKRKSYETGEPIDDEETFDAVFWTAGSKPSFPEDMSNLKRTSSSRVAVRPSLQCIRDDETAIRGLWAVGDCAEVVGEAFPKTGSVALQQGVAVAGNIETTMNGGYPQAFEFRELGSMLTLGGPNAAIQAPKSGALAPIFSPIIDIADKALSFVDKALQAAPDGLRPDTTLISFGSHGLGAENDESSGVLAGTLSGAVRRTVYAALMPTNTQRVIALLSASASTAASLAKEVSERKNL